MTADWSVRASDRLTGTNRIGWMSKAEDEIHHKIEGDKIGKRDPKSPPLLAGVWPPPIEQNTRQDRIGTEGENLHPTGPSRDWSEHDDDSTHLVRSSGRITAYSEIVRM